MRRLLLLGGVVGVLGLTLATAPASAQNKKIKRDRYVLTQEEVLEQLLLIVGHPELRAA